MTAPRPSYDPDADIETFAHLAGRRAEPLPPRFSDADFRTVAMEALRTVAEAENAGVITEADANGRVERLTAFNRDLTAEGREMAYEQLREALKRLEEVRSDMWDQSEGDRLLAEYSADDDVESAIRKLVGRRK